MSDHLRFPKMKESLTPQKLNPGHEYVIDLRQMPVVEQWLDARPKR